MQEGGLEGERESVLAPGAQGRGGTEGGRERRERECECVSVSVSMSVCVCVCERECECV